MNVNIVHSSIKCNVESCKSNIFKFTVKKNKKRKVIMFHTFTRRKKPLQVKITFPYSELLTVHLPTIKAND